MLFRSDAVIDTNLRQPERMLAKLRAHCRDLAGLPVTVLGLAFKEDTDDMRESPAIPIVKMLVDAGARVTAYDPIASNAARPLLPAAVSYATSLEQAVASAAAILLVTRWEEFQRLPELLKHRMPAPWVIDGRRVLAHDAFERYDGIGR